MKFNLTIVEQEKTFGFDFVNRTYTDGKYVVNKFFEFRNFFLLHVS